MASKPAAGPPAKHTQAAVFRPHAPAQVTQTVGMNPDPPADRQASEPADDGVGYAGESPEGYDPYTLGIQY